MRTIIFFLIASLNFSQVLSFVEINSSFWERYVPDPFYTRSKDYLRLDLQNTIMVSGHMSQEIHEKAGPYTAFTQTTPGKAIKAQFIYPIPDELKSVDTDEARTLGKI